MMFQHNLSKFSSSMFILISDLWSLKKLTQTDTKVIFQAPPPPTRKLFLVSNERYGQNKTFLLQCYCIDFAPIKRYRPFCFLWLYIRRQRLTLYDLSQLIFICVSVFFFFLSSLFFRLVHLYFFSFCIMSVFFFLYVRFFLFVCLSFLLYVCLFLHSVCLLSFVFCLSIFLSHCLFSFWLFIFCLFLFCHFILCLFFFDLFFLLSCFC